MIGNKQVLFYALLVFGAVIFFFTPIFGHEFGYHNDYLIWDYNYSDCCFGHPETRHVIGIGRPILAVLLNIHLMFIRDMQLFWISHLFSVLMIGFAASLCFVYFQNELNISRFGAGLLSVLIFTLPSMTVNSFWITNFTSEILPLFIVLLAHALVQKRNISGHNRNRIVVTVFGLVFVSLLIYPPVALFFLTLTFIKFIFGTKDPDRAELSDLLFEVRVVLVACLIYFLAIKFIWPTILLKSHFGGFDWQEFTKVIDNQVPEYKFALDLNLTSKIMQARDYLVLVFSAWFPPLKFFQIIPLICVFMLTLAWSALSSPYLKQFGTSSKMFMGLAISILIILLTGLPVLAGPSIYEINYRAIFPSMAIIPVAIVFIIDRVVLVRKGWHPRVFVPALLIVSVLIIAAEISSFHRVALVVERSSEAYRKVHDALRHNVSDHTREIRVQIPLMPPPDSRYLHADFGLPATIQGLGGIVKAALQEIGRNPDNYFINLDSEFVPDNSGESVLISSLTGASNGK